MDYIVIGAVLGLSAGFAPGPLLTLVISETIQHGVRSGIRVALSPIFTDLPIICITLGVLSGLSDFQFILGIISLLGGFVILFMGYECFHPEIPEQDFSNKKQNSTVRGILANALSPHPYLFWFSVGGPVMNNAMKINIFSVLSFVGSFYILLVGSKILLAIIVGRSRLMLNGNWYVYILRLLGLALWVLAYLLFRDGLRMIGLF